MQRVLCRGHPNKKPDGPDSLLKIVARNHNVSIQAIQNIWMRKTYKSVTR